MAEFHITIQGRPSHIERRDDRLVVDESGRAEPLPISFDEAYGRLEKIPQLFIEPDGAFLWSGWDRKVDPPRERWRLDGCLYDSGPRLQYVELKGRCEVDQVWQTLLEALGADDRKAMIQHLRSGHFVSLDDFDPST